MLDRFFALEAHDTSIRIEVLAGFTTFLTMIYIVVVNPSILATPGTGMPFSGVLTATVLLCFALTLLMGLYADLPFAAMMFKGRIEQEVKSSLARWLT